MGDPKAGQVVRGWRYQRGLDRCGKPFGAGRYPPVAAVLGTYESPSSHRALNRVSEALWQVRKAGISASAMPLLGDLPSQEDFP
jgi:hypothetical protein